MISFNFNILRTFHVTSVVASLLRNLRRRNASSNDEATNFGGHRAQHHFYPKILVVVLEAKKSHFQIQKE